MGELATSPKKREKILKLQGSISKEIESGELEAYDPDVVHHFAPGLYARECHLNAGSIVVGKIHKHAHINTISKGKVRVFTEFDDEVLEYEAPCTFTSIPGSKRAVYAIEDTIWTTYHPTDKTDLESIEDEVIAPSYEDFEIHICYEQKKMLEENEK